MARLRSGPVDSKVDLPITPMLDMTFQLLAFFVLTFQPQSALEGRLEFTLPVAERSGRLPPDDPKWIEQEVERPLESAAQLTLQVRTVRDGLHDGNISALILE